MLLKEICNVSLSEMAGRNPDGFDMSEQDWIFHKDGLKDSNVIHKIDSETDIRVKDTVFSLWKSNEIVCFVIFKLDKLPISNSACYDLKFIGTDPVQNQKGFAFELMTTLFEISDYPILIGGAVSPKGEKLINKLIKAYTEIQGKKPKAINTVFGDEVDFDKRFFRDSAVSLLFDSHDTV